MAKKYILTADDVIDNLTSEDTSVPLSANQGKVLKTYVDSKQDTIDSEHKLNADYVSDGTNNKVYTSTEKTKLEGIETGAQVNKIESIKANGTKLSIVDKAVNIPIATDSTAGLKYNSSSCIKVYVSPTGSDTTGDGSQAKPWREIQTALENTANLGYEWVRVNCSAGTYEKPIKTGFNYPNCVIFANGDITTPGMEFNQNCGKIILSSVSSTTNINVITTEQYGIILAFGCSLLKQDGILNITASQQGIRIGGQTSTVSTPFKWFIQSFELMGTTNITITSGSGSQGAISVYYPTARLCIDTLNIDNPNGTGIRLTNQSHICTVNKLNCNGTPYSLGFGSVLFIGGKLVNQYESLRTVYVSPNGDDTTGDGTQANPWREIQTAIEKTDWYPVNMINIGIQPGDYYKQIYTKTHRHMYRLSVSDDVTLHNNMIISSTTLMLSGSRDGITFTVDTTEDKGIALYYGGSLFQNMSYLHINCAKTGIFVGGQTGDGTSETNLTNYIRLRESKITLTETNAVGVDANAFPTGFIRLGKMAVNGVSGVALKIGSHNVCIAGAVTTNLTQYTVLAAGVLSINGQWVNQSGGGNAVWGQITGDLNSQTDLTSFVNNKPTILSGTSEPTPEQGKTGDIYVRYNV